MNTAGILNLLGVAGVIVIFYLNTTLLFKIEKIKQLHSEANNLKKSLDEWTNRRS